MMIWNLIIMLDLNIFQKILNLLFLFLSVSETTGCMINFQLIFLLIKCNHLIGILLVLALDIQSWFDFKVFLGC